MNGYTIGATDLAFSYGQSPSGYSAGVPVPAGPAAVAAPAAPPITAQGLAFGPGLGGAPVGYTPQVAPVGAAAAQGAQGQGFLGRMGIMGADGLNWQNLASLGQGIAGIAGVWNAFQQNKIARDTLKFQKQAFQTNLRNQTQTYNTQLEGIINSRYSQEGRSAGEAQAYIDSNKLRM